MAYFDMAEGDQDVRVARLNRIPERAEMTKLEARCWRLLLFAISLLGARILTSENGNKIANEYNKLRIELEQV